MAQDGVEPSGLVVVRRHHHGDVGRRGTCAARRRRRSDGSRRRRAARRSAATVRPGRRRRCGRTRPAPASVRRNSRNGEPPSTIVPSPTSLGRRVEPVAGHRRCGSMSLSHGDDPVVVIARVEQPVGRRARRWDFGSVVGEVHVASSRYPHERSVSTILAAAGAGSRVTTSAGLGGRAGVGELADAGEGVARRHRHLAWAAAGTAVSEAGRSTGPSRSGGRRRSWRVWAASSARQRRAGAAAPPSPRPTAPSVTWRRAPRAGRRRGAGRRGSDPSLAPVDGDEAERLPDAELGGEERRHRAAAAIGRRVTAHAPTTRRRTTAASAVATASLREVGGRVDAYGADGAGREGRAQAVLGARAGRR